MPAFWVSFFSNSTITSRKEESAMISQKNRKENMENDATTSSIERMKMFMNETIRFFLPSCCNMLNILH